MKREELDIYEIEEKEKLAEDCKNTGNFAMRYIRNQFVINLEESRVDFIKKYNIPREDQVLVNKFVAFLKERA